MVSTSIEEEPLPRMGIEETSLGHLQGVVVCEEMKTLVKDVTENGTRNLLAVIYFQEWIGRKAEKLSAETNILKKVALKVLESRKKVCNLCVKNISNDESVTPETARVLITFVVRKLQVLQRILLMPYPRTN